MCCSTATATATTTALYRPGKQMFDVYKPGVTVHVFVPARHLIREEDTSAQHIAARLERQGQQQPDGQRPHNNSLPPPVLRRVWGTDVYTHNSDLIAACRHSGMLSICDLEEHLPNLKGLAVTIKIHDGANRRYVSSYRNGVRSRGWSSHEGNAYSIESCRILQDELSPAKKISRVQKKILLAQAEDDTDAEQARFLPNVAIVYSLSNEPWLKYSLSAIADKGFDEKSFTSYRMNEEVLFLESKTQRFQLYLDEESKRFKFDLVSSPHKLDSVAMSKLELPLVDQENIASGLRWKEIEWGPVSVTIGGHSYDINAIQFVKRTRPIIKEEEEEEEEAQNNHATTEGNAMQISE